MNKKCKECGQELKQSGPFAKLKKEGEPAFNGPQETSYWCINEKCVAQYKNIKTIS